MMTPEETKNWIFDALADGWTIEPGDRYDSQILRREGYTGMVTIRSGEGGTLVYSEFGLYGPDRLNITAPRVYSWERVTAGLRTCGFCHATDVRTFRVSFAARCCLECLPAQRDRLEYPGWAD